MSLQTEIFSAIERGANDAELARICRENAHECRVQPKPGSHWTKEAFNLAQEMLERGCPKPLIIDRLKRHFIGPFTVAQLYDKFRKGALIAHPKKRGV